jgi:hypothetical protein
MSKFYTAVAIFFVPIFVAFAQTTLDGPGPTTLGHSATLKNPLGFESLCGFLKAVFNAAVTIGIPIAVLFIVWAGFLFVLARGRPDALQRAKTNAMYVVIGLAVFLGAWFLSQIIAATISALGVPSISSCK